MGQYIYGLGLVFLMLTGYITFHQSQLFQEHYFKAKYYVEEAAVAAAQFNSLQSYSDGHYVFNTSVAEQAAVHFLKSNFHLNNNLEPVSQTKGYWKNEIDYQLFFFDINAQTCEGRTPNFTTNVAENYCYTNPYTNERHTVALDGPSVVLVVNLGKASTHTRKLFDNENDSITILTAIHTFVD